VIARQEKFDRLKILKQFFKAPIVEELRGSAAATRR
jgi:hypothetical protein